MFERPRLLDGVDWSCKGGQEVRGQCRNQRRRPAGAVPDVRLWSAAHSPNPWNGLSPYATQMAAAEPKWAKGVSSGTRGDAWSMAFQVGTFTTHGPTAAVSCHTHVVCPTHIPLLHVTATTHTAIDEHTPLLPSSSSRLYNRSGASGMRCRCAAARPRRLWPMTWPAAGRTRRKATMPCAAPPTTSPWPSTRRRCWASC